MNSPADPIMECRICKVVTTVSQARLDEIIRTRPGTSDLCNVCFAKYGQYEQRPGGRSS